MNKSMNEEMKDSTGDNKKSNTESNSESNTKNNTENNAKINAKKRENSQGTVRLSLRLKAVADYVRPGSRIADIGTDHGYIPLYLAQTGRAASALAMDVRTGPLERAREHIKRYEEWAGGAGAEETKASAAAHCAIETRLSDGLKELRPGEADTVIIAGMGGELEIRILEEGRHVWDSVTHWILSPQSDLDKVRLYLEEQGFFIEDETMVKEEGKFYTVMSVIRGQMKYGRPVWYCYGKPLLEKRDRVLKEFLEKEKDRVAGILDTLMGQPQDAMTPGQERAKKALLEELYLIKEAQDEMQ